MMAHPQRVAAQQSSSIVKDGYDCYDNQAVRPHDVAQIHASCSAISISSIPDLPLSARQVTVMLTSQ